MKNRLNQHVTRNKRHKNSYVLGEKSRKVSTFLGVFIYLDMISKHDNKFVFDEVSISLMLISENITQLDLKG